MTSSRERLTVTTPLILTTQKDAPSSLPQCPHSFYRRVFLWLVELFRLEVMHLPISQFSVMPFRSITTLTRSSRIFAGNPQYKLTSFQHRTMASTGTPSATAQAQADEQASSGAPASSHSFTSLDIKNTNIQTAPGVDLSEQQKVTIGSVLDVSLTLSSSGSYQISPVSSTSAYNSGLCSCLKDIRRSPSSLFGHKMPPSRITLPSQQDTPNIPHNSMVYQHSSSPSNYSTTV